MPVDMLALTGDLAAESAELYAVLSGLGERDWERETPSAGWTIRDQVAHLAYFDEVATLPALDPARFRREAADLVASGDDFAAEVVRRFRHRTGAAVFAWLQHSRRAYLDAFRVLEPTTSLLWFGPPMSAASSVTARLMETWAHGQDVLDVMGVLRAPTPRLRHIAHLGVRTLGWSFQVHGLPTPEQQVRVVLTAPGGGTWSWGPPEAANHVRGEALDFCLVVTQRRNRGQTTLRAVGPVADAWLDVAQCFAGPAGPGRPPSPAGTGT